MADEIVDDAVADDTTVDDAPDTVDFEQLYAGQQAFVAELQATIVELNANVTALQAANYQLLMAIPSDEDAEEVPTDEVNGDGEPIAIADLFTTEEKE